ncbi:MAG: hypothetical protein ABH827_03280 [bacterium]
MKSPRVTAHVTVRAIMRLSIQILFSCLLTCFISKNVSAKLHFSSQSSALAMQTDTSRLRISKKDNVQGWNQQSIIEKYNPDNSWLADNTILGYGPGVTSKPSTEFIINNSNAIAYNVGNVTTLINNATILSFDGRIKNNSNTINYYAPTIRSSSRYTIQNSNALTYGIRTNSNVIVTIADAIDISVGDLIINGPTRTIGFDIYAALDNKIIVQTDCVLNGNGHFIQFAQNNPGCFQIYPGKTITLKNIALKDFSDNVFSFGDANAKVLFSDGTTIALSRFKQTETLSRNWVFYGSDMALYGFGNSIDMNSLSIQVTGTLALQNIILDNLKDSLLTAMTSQSNIILKDSTLALSREFLATGYSFTTGALTIQSDTIITGSKIFSYKSNRPLTISSKSTLIIDTGTGFKYEPTTNNRDLVVMEDVTSRLFLNSCEFASSSTGMRLTKGTLLIDGTNDIETPDSVASSEGISFGNGNIEENLNIEMFPGANMIVTGILNLDNK